MIVFALSLIFLFLSQDESVDDVVHVHEWGVIQLDEVTPTAQGACWGFLNERGFLEPYYSMLVDAPVVWFHGPECTGTLTVEVQNGFFTTLLPYPDSIETRLDNLHDRIGQPYGENYVAVWRDLRLSESSPVDVLPSCDEFIYAEEGFLWALPIWREVPSLTVDYNQGSHIDKFIYYECSASGFIGSSETAGQSPLDNAMEWLEFQDDDGELFCFQGNIDLGGLPSTMSDMEILLTLAEWGNGEFLPEEIAALWKTWKPVLRTRCIRDGQRVALFPFTEEQVESICTIEFETDMGHHVEYSRLFLGLITLE